MKYDVIVIGAGNGGLTAALSLQKQGKKVLLLEAHHLPGGFATSFVRGRFEFDASLHALCEYGTEELHGGVYDLWEQLGVLDRISMTQVLESYHVISLKNKEEYEMPFGVTEFIQKMEDYVPGSKKSVTNFFALAEETKQAFRFINQSGGTFPVDTLQEKCPHFLKFFSSSVDEVLDYLKMPKKAQEILTVYWVYLGSPTKNLSFVHFATMLYSYVRNGVWIPRMRSHEISLVLQEEFELYGGDVRFFSRVKEIMMENGKVIGVICEDGSSFYANHIIADISPTNVYGSLLPEKERKKEMKQLCNARTLGARGFCVYLGLNKSPEELGLSHYSYFIYDSMDSNLEAKKMREFVHDGCVAVVLHHDLVSRVPKDTTMICITSLYFGDTFDKYVSEDHYFEIKEKLGRHFIEVFEKATGVSIMDAIEEIEIATPVTFARYGGHPDGTIYGYMAKGYDNLMARLLHSKQEEYLPNVRFCGGFGVRLSGYSSSYLSGELAGYQTLIDMAEEEMDDEIEF